MNLTFGSLFAGIGGFDLGFEQAGMVCKWQVEIDDYANRVLAKHWPTVHRERDIRQCGKHNLEAVDVICGGFPCQDISYAGLGAGLDGERSGLFFEAIRVVRELRPQIVVLENVAALLTRGLDRVLGTLAEIGYDAEWHCIPAAYVGAPHIRDRVLVVANSVSERVRMQGCEKDARKATGVQKETQKRKRIRIDARSNGELRDVADANSNNEQRRRRNVQMGRQWITRETQVNGQSRGTQWATEPAVGRVADGVSNRVDRLRGLGNAVVPQVAEFIGRQIVRAISEEEK